MVSDSSIFLESGINRIMLQPETGTILSFQTDGVEWLWLNGDASAYESDRSLGGIPILFPWANRLSSWEVLTAPGLRREIPESSRNRIWSDGRGLPIHGTMLKRQWRIQSMKTDQAILAFDPDEEDFTVFPFRYSLRLEIVLSWDALRICLVIENGEQSMPLAAGLHPYIRLAALARHQDDLRFALPLRDHIETDERMIPDGRVEPAGDFWPVISASTSVGPSWRRWATLDDGFLLEPVSGDRLHCFTLMGSLRTLRLRWGSEFPVVIVYTPGSDYLCIEPMTAPTNAWHLGHLSSWSLKWLKPGARHRLCLMFETSEANMR